MRQRILVVDDDAASRMHAATCLREAGFEADEAASAADALFLVETARPALVVADLHMPEIDGRALLAAMKSQAETQAIPMVMLTGESDSRVRAACLDGGAADVICKPVDGAELAARVRAQLRTARAMARLRTQSELDELTGVLNRRGLLGALDRELAAAGRAQAPIALLLVDADRFKRINDEHGHLVGDRVLRDIAELLAGSVRSCDTVGRLGGDEFVVILPGARPAEAARVADRIREQRLAVPGTDREVTLSIGVVVEPPGEDGALRLLEAADRAMYRDKREQQATAA